MLAMIEKHKHGYAIRLKSGWNAGELCEDHAYVYHWSNEETCKAWLLTAGYVLIKTLCVYRQLEITKGSDRHFYVFNFEGEQLLIDYKFKKEATAKELIDWHYDAV